MFLQDLKGQEGSGYEQGCVAWRCSKPCRTAVVDPRSMLRCYAGGHDTENLPLPNRIGDPTVLAASFRTPAMAQQLSPEFYRSYTRHATDDPRQREAASARRQRELLLRYQGGAATASAGCAASAAVPAVPSPRPPRRRPPSASSAAPPKPASGRRSKRGGDRGGEAAAEGPAHAAASSSRERERLLVELAAIRRDLEGRAPHERGGRRGGSGGRSRAGGEAALPAQLRSVLEGQIQLLEESNLELERSACSSLLPRLPHVRLDA